MQTSQAEEFGGASRDGATKTAMRSAPPNGEREGSSVWKDVIWGGPSS